MQPLPPSTGRTTRLALVAGGLIALLAIVAFASRSGFGHGSQSSPSQHFISYAFSAFLILFAAMIPVAGYAFVVQMRESVAGPRKSFVSRVIQNIATLLFFVAAGAVLLYLKKHHWHFRSIHTNKLTGGPSKLHSGRHGSAPAQHAPHFEWSVLWIALALGAIGTIALVVAYRRDRARRAATAPEQTDAEALVETISDAIEDLEAEPDPRRAVIAAYARMERLLKRRGLGRQPSETPLEFLRRALLRLTTRGVAVERLTALFEQAKFSRHEIDSGMKSEAIGALREIRDDVLGAPA